jgi:hypothetical protein
MQYLITTKLLRRTKVIDGSCGDLSRPGDAFSDLFRFGHINRSAGNLESIWAVQYEYLTPGGGTGGNVHVRWWGPKFEDVTDPTGKKMLVNNSLGRCQGGVRPNTTFYMISGKTTGTIYGIHNITSVVPGTGITLHLQPV